jgi:hypothetical protein
VALLISLVTIAVPIIAVLSKLLHRERRMNRRSGVYRMSGGDIEMSSVENRRYSSGSSGDGNV